ncbi:hypothetical protein [Nitrincola alkalilacustris]|uniref:hypothetical protein n=1 Tax=Nitrincola alkalilacustris TaxID=1571224 RepID=UPI00124BCBE4|nr:hypothetical protein [Nitrincola alkalilacustris]
MKTGQWIGAIIAVIIFQLIAPYFFDLSEGFNILRTLMSIVAAVMGAMVGSFVAESISSRK